MHCIHPSCKSPIPAGIKSQFHEYCTIHQINNAIRLAAGNKFFELVKIIHPKFNFDSFNYIEGDIRGKFACNTCNIPSWSTPSQLLAQPKMVCINCIPQNSNALTFQELQQISTKQQAPFPIRTKNVTPQPPQPIQPPQHPPPTVTFNPNNSYRIIPRNKAKKRPQPAGRKRVTPYEFLLRVERNKSPTNRWILDLNQITYTASRSPATMVCANCNTKNTKMARTFYERTKQVCDNCDAKPTQPNHIEEILN